MDTNNEELIIKLREENCLMKTTNQLLESDLIRLKKLITTLEDIKTISFQFIKQCKCGQQSKQSKLKTKLNILKSIYERESQQTSQQSTYDLNNEYELITSNNEEDIKFMNNQFIDINNHEENNKIKTSLLMISRNNNMKKKRGRKRKNITINDVSVSVSDENINMSKKTKHCQWPGCEAVFRDRIDLENHMWRHTGEKLYQCDWPGCGKQFASKCIMRKHQETHLDPQRFKCEFDKCCAAFINSDELDIHFKHSHNGVKPYICDYQGCQKQCSSKLNLQKHHYSHKEPKKFKCQWTDCNESYVKRNQLMAHECKVHTGVKPFKCDWPGCDYEACYEQTLKNHQLRHTDDKPFKCSWPKCEWKFRRNDHLKVHMLKHTGEKPFGCDWPGCDRKFQTRQTLKIHVEKTHGNQ